MKQPRLFQPVQGPGSRLLASGGLILAVAIAAFALAYGSLAFTREVGRIAAIWPVNAVILAVMLHSPRARWLEILGAGLAGNLAANLIGSDTPLIALGLSGCNGVEIWLCAQLLRWKNGPDSDLAKPRDLVAFLIIAGMAAPFTSAVLAATIIQMAGLGGFGPSLVQWFTPDALGLITVTPALLALTPATLQSLGQRLRTPRGMSAVFVTALSLCLVFSQDRYPILFLIPPALIFVAFELNLGGAALALLTSSAVAVVLTLTGHGPAALIKGDLSERLHILQLFLATMTIAVLPVASALAKRRRLDRELREALTDVSQARATVAESHRLSILAQEIAGIGYWRRDMQTGRSIWSDAMFAIHGLKQTSFDPQRDDSMFVYGEEDQKRIRETVRTAAETGAPYDLTVKLKRASDGAERIVQFKGDTERDGEDQVVALIGVMRDITDEEVNKARLEESEARFRLLADSATDVILKVDRNDVIQYVSPSASRYGYEPEAMIGLSGYTLVHPDDLPKLREIITELFTGAVDPARDRTYRVRTASGDYVWMEGNPALVRDSAGIPIAVISQLRDISERQAANLALAESEAHFRLLADSASDVLLKVDTNDVVQYVSPSADRFGYAPEDLIGKTGASFIHPEDLPKVLDRVGRLARGERIETGEDRSYRMRRSDGSYVWIEANSSAVKDDAGRTVTIICQLRDITERKAALSALAESEARYRLLTANATDVIACYGLDGVLTFLSPSLTAMLGYEPHELVGKQTSVFMHPDDIKPVLRRFASYVSAGPGADPIRFEYRAYRKDGEMVWLEAQAKAIIDPLTGQVTEFQDVVRDITARKAMEAALAESQLRYQVIVEKSTDVISRTCLDGTLSYVSPAVAQVTGYSPEELIGQNLASLMHPDDIAPMVDIWRQALAGERKEQAPVVYRGRHKDGHWLALECNPTPVRDSDGRPTEFIDVTRDVSARVQLEAELRAAKDAAEAAAAAKSDFMANMSHEIRTPLTAILGFTRLLSDEPALGEAAQNHVSRVASAGQALLAIVNDILDFSKLEAGQVEIASAPTDPEVMLRDCLMLFSPQADAKELALRLKVDALPPCVLVDQHRVRQVLLNLIGNAVKFTEKGEIVVAAKHDAARGQLAIEVRDTGAGLSVPQQQKLFQRFSQVDASSTRRHGGTGLGLAICKGLVEAMGGEIGVRSIEGEGSTFFFSISSPLGEFAPTAPVSSGPSYLSGARLLVADDNPINRELAKAILAPFGACVSEAEDGAAALLAAMESPFDIILLDIRMPGLAGSEVAARLRAEPGPNRDIPILAFTADADLRRYGEGSDFDGAISKPILPAVLIEELNRRLAWGEDVEEERDAAIG